MALIDRLLERRQSPENSTTNLANAAFWLIDALGGGPSKTGVRVNPKTALGSTAVLAAVTLIADTIGSLPLKVYERLDPRGKRLASEHPLYDVLHNQPNPEMTAPVFFETAQAHLLLWGNAYAEIQRNGRGDVIALWPLLPDQTRVGRRPDGGKFYVTRVPDGTEIALGLEDVLHIPGLSFNGRVGLSPIALAREAVGLALATEEYGARFFSNSAEPGGVLEHPARLTPETHVRLRESWTQTHQGLNNAHRIAILEEGMKWHQMAIPNKDAQFLEARRFQTQEIARLFRVPPHMIGDVERTTSWGTGIEQQGIGFVVYGLRRYLVRWEKGINALLFPGNDRGRFFAEFLVDGLQRGDHQARAESLRVEFEHGALNIDEWREIENRNPLPDGEGQKHFVPLNMTTVGQAGQPPPAAPAPDPEPDDLGDSEPDDATRGASRRLLLIAQEDVARVVQKEVARVRDKAPSLARDAVKWRAWIEHFYVDYARVVGERLQLEPRVVRHYIERHQRELLSDGVIVLERWSREAPGELLQAVLAGQGSADRMRIEKEEP